MFADIDVLLVDLIDVGTRVYTFIWTVVHCLETAAETGVKIPSSTGPIPSAGIWWRAMSYARIARPLSAGAPSPCGTA